jgi:hypothetical protein
MLYKYVLLTKRGHGGRGCRSEKVGFGDQDQNIRNGRGDKRESA